ncbi:alpha-2,8-polysialyltransferase family protein [Acinetobacter towneri]|uniref:alpha-2,8-polysialyltransferase family protein n=1 Tax=Acinetobacter towneri TaxID=202956 RepID=UPI002097A1CF|nr:alpha-2,8-polysialyltransferase family protein [Acinetobacter towneri]MCO8054022.1 alpha-2,8-polysialyltransferase family protein [Acinetobacter towneri]
MGNGRKNKKLIGYGLVSPLHLANFMSYYYSNSDSYDKLTIYLNDYWGRGILNNRYLDFLKSKNIEVKEKLNIEELVCDFDIVFVGGVDWRVLYKIKNNIVNLVVIDEGLSSYVSFFGKKKSNKNLKFYKYIISTLIINLLTLSIKGDKINFKMFDMVSMNINSDYRLGLFKYFHELSVLDREVVGLENTNTNTIIFCAQPWVEMGEMSEDKYINYIKDIKKNIESKGFNFVLKKHPAENIVDYTKYGINLISDSRMIEEIVFSTKIKAIISKYSTSSFLVPALFNTTSYLLDKNELKFLGWSANKLFNKYCIDLKDLNVSKDN